jgi:hypothetical protein
VNIMHGVLLRLLSYQVFGALGRGAPVVGRGEELGGGGGYLWCMGEVRFPCENSISTDVNLFHVLLHLDPKRIPLPHMVEAKAKANRLIRTLYFIIF